MTVNIELRKGARRGTQVIIADGAEVGKVEYNSRGRRGAEYEFHHPAPKHSAVVLPNAPHQTSGNRRPVTVTTQDAIPIMARKLVEDGILRPVAHWQKEFAERRAKEEAREMAERTRERVERAGPVLLKACKKAREWMAYVIERCAINPAGNKVDDKDVLAVVDAAIKQAEED